MTAAPACPLTIVVVEYLSQPHLGALMASLATHQPDAPVIISSNSEYSPDEVRRMAAIFPRALFLRNDGNLGYAGGVNRALAHVRTPFVAILNPDVTLTRSMAVDAIGAFERDGQLGLFGPRVLDGDGVPTFSFRRFYPPSYILARYFGLGALPGLRGLAAHYLMQESSRDAVTYADWVSGGAMFVRMDAARTVGPMDERYFLYMEDMDWCRSFWRAGWRVGYEPSIALVHRAQHAGTRRGLAGVLSLSTRRQIRAYFQYLLKWGGLAYSPAAQLQHPLWAAPSATR